MVYAGVSWTVPLFHSPVFVEAAFGGAVHTGKKPRPNADARAQSRLYIAVP
jgi:hypothetical protein